MMNAPNFPMPLPTPLALTRVYEKRRKKECMSEGNTEEKEREKKQKG